MPQAFLAPDIVEASLDGRLPGELTAKSLKQLSPLPSDWESRRRLVGMAREIRPVLPTVRTLNEGSRDFSPFWAVRSPFRRLRLKWIPPKVRFRGVPDLTMSGARFAGDWVVVEAVWC